MILYRCRVDDPLLTCIVDDPIPTAASIILDRRDLVLLCIFLLSLLLLPYRTTAVASVPSTLTIGTFHTDTTSVAPLLPTTTTVPYIPLPRGTVSSKTIPCCSRIPEELLDCGANLCVYIDSRSLPVKNKHF